MGGGETSGRCVTHQRFLALFLTKFSHRKPFLLEISIKKFGSVDPFITWVEAAILLVGDEARSARDFFAEGP